MATAENRDACLNFAQAVADYCYDQAERARADDDEDGADKWDAAESSASELVDELRELAGVEER